jgi:hypothetical protein
MNAQRDIKVGYGKALAALTTALSCLAIYILACVMSPVTWSPDSSKIALLVTPPGDDPDKFAIFTYDIATGERTLLDQAEADGALSAPAWSPDGKWIAYYKVEPSPPEEPDPNTNAATTESARKTSAKPEANKAAEQEQPTVTAAELFSEEHKMLTPHLLEMFKQQLYQEVKVRETFDVKLMAVKPDGKERKVLRVLKWLGDEEARKWVALVRPEWSLDSSQIFYARGLAGGELYYISRLDLSTDETQLHLFSAIGIPAASPDGMWIASLLKIDSQRVLLAVERIDGTVHKYFKLEPGVDAGQASSLLKWSPDSKHILVPAKEEFRLIDTRTGSVKKYHEQGLGEIASGTLSPDGGKLYYVAGRQTGDPNSPEQKAFFEYTSLTDEETETVFELTDFPESADSMMFHIAPDCKTVLLRCVIKDEHDDKKSTLIFWDGKTKKVVETDSWLTEPQNAD